MVYIPGGIPRVYTRMYIPGGIPRVYTRKGTMEAYIPGGVPWERIYQEIPRVYTRRNTRGVHKEVYLGVYTRRCT